MASLKFWAQSHLLEFHENLRTGILVLMAKLFLPSGGPVVLLQIRSIKIMKNQKLSAFLTAVWTYNGIVKQREIHEEKEGHAFHLAVVLSQQCFYPHRSKHSINKILSPAEYQFFFFFFTTQPFPLIRLLLTNKHRATTRWHHFNISTTHSQKPFLSNVNFETKIFHKLLIDGESVKKKKGILLSSN